MPTKLLLAITLLTGPYALAQGRSYGRSMVISKEGTIATSQVLAHAQFVSNIVDYGMNIQEAMEASHFAKNNANGCDVSIQFRVPPTTLQKFSEHGHIVRIACGYVEGMGRGQAILHNSATGMNFAASEPRADGAAIPEPIHL